QPDHQISQRWRQPRVHLQSGEVHLDFISVLVPIAGTRRQVWIVGHSIVHWAVEWAARSSAGEQLGLKHTLRIEWLGMRGMLWDRLLPTVWKRAREQGHPDTLIVQLGENDLTGWKGIDLILSMKATLEFLHDSFPDMMIIWSDLLQQRVWRGAASIRGVERARRKINRAIGNLVSQWGRVIISHHDISFRNSKLFRQDGVHLSDMGMEQWLKSIKAAIVKWWKLQYSGGRRV
ncbi:hypothetical protein JRQ81_001510, partial [Phrynocephalus forsythii]